MKKRNAEAAQRIREGEGFLTIEAIKNGDALTRLSALIFGLGSLVRGQPSRFALLMLTELAFVVFMIVKGMNRLTVSGKEEKPAAEGSPPRVCPYCKSAIHQEASRCPACTSQL